MTLVENKNGGYPKMQNPGVPRVFDAPPTLAKHVLIKNGATIADPDDYDEKVMLWGDAQKPSEEEELKALTETTYPTIKVGTQAGK